MKLFSWVHGKFHKGSNSGNANHNELSRKSPESNVLLKQIALVDMHDGWKDGILSIGTFGFKDPFEPFKQDSESFNLVSEGKEENDDQNQQCFSNEDNFSDNNDLVTREDQVDSLVIHSNEYVPKQELQDTKPDNVRDIKAVSLHERSTEVVKKKMERVTLADLFKADSDMEKKIKDNHGGLYKQDGGKNEAVTRKNSNSFVKKLVHNGKDNSIKKFQKLLKRMSKKKIHPEPAVKSDKKNVHFKPSVHKQFLNEEEAEASESIALLFARGSLVHLEV